MHCYYSGKVELPGQPLNLLKQRGGFRHFRVFLSFTSAIKTKGLFKLGNFEFLPLSHLLCKFYGHRLP